MPIDSNDRNHIGSPFQPIGVTVVAVLILIGAIFSLFWVVALRSWPDMLSYIQETSSSVSSLIFLVIVYAGLSIACGIGMLNGKNWARMLYIGFVPVLILLAIINGFRITMLVGIVQYIIFVIILTRPDASDYFRNRTPGT
ncbi:MAG: hypothetical protein ABFD49_04950 [Armatimonadota bacterium]